MRSPTGPPTGDQFRMTFKILPSGIRYTCQSQLCGRWRRPNKLSKWEWVRTRHWWSGQTNWRRECIPDIEEEYLLSWVEAPSITVIEQQVNNACPIYCNFVVRDKFTVIPHSRCQPGRHDDTTSDGFVQFSDEGEGVWNAGAEVSEFMNHLSRSYLLILMTRGCSASWHITLVFREATKFLYIKIKFLICHYSHRYLYHINYTIYLFSQSSFLCICFMWLTSEIFILFFFLYLHAPSLQKVFNGLFFLCCLDYN